MTKVIVNIDNDAKHITIKKCDIESKIAAAACLITEIGKETGLEAAIGIVKITTLRMLINEDGSRRLDIGVSKFDS